MKKYLSFCLALILGASLFMSCEKETPNIKEISLERWAVEGDSSSYQKTSIQYLEKVNFKESGVEDYRLFYDENKNLSGKEIRVFQDNDKFPKGSQFKNPQDSLLSYYTFITDNNGNITEKKAFSAISNELLRIESIEYNKNNFPISKTIKSADGMPVRKFVYTVDNKGNELQVQVLQPDGSEILTEIFKITKYDNFGKAVEKWGFVDDQPFSFIARKIEYYN